MKREPVYCYECDEEADPVYGYCKRHLRRILEGDKRSDASVICPSCGFESVNADECEMCGQMLFLDLDCNE